VKRPLSEYPAIPDSAPVDLIFDQQHLDRLANLAWIWTVTFVPRLVAAIAILVCGVLVARWASRAALGLAYRAGHVDPTVQPVLGAMVRYAVLILAFIAALSQVGIQTASLFAVLGAAGLAIGLALQGTLSNIAAGIMLLWLRPFRLGDYIEVNGMSGIVREIGLFVCHLEAFDGIFVFAPNAAIWNSPLRNHSRNAGRLISIDITLPAKAEIERARGLLLALAEGDRRILPRPHPRVFVETQTGAGLVLSLHIWASHDAVGEIQRTIIERARQQLEAAGIDTLQPQQIVRTVPAANDPSRFLSASLPYAD
jgi:small conductance mechanosensitive channel